MNHRRQGVQVRGLELRQLAILHQQRGKRVSFISQFLQHAGIGRWTGCRLLLDGKLQLFEENRPQLWIGIDVESLSRFDENLLLYPLALTLKSLLE